MKHIYSRLLLCLLLVLCGPVCSYAQVTDLEKTGSLNHTWRTVRSTQGRDFFVTFMKNAGTEMDDKSLALQLRIATVSEDANVTVEYKYNSSSSSVYRETFLVKKDSIYTYTVPENRRQYAYALDEQKAGYRSVRVVSDKDISVYACNYGKSSYDATMVLPIETLGKEYVIQTFSKDRYATEFAIVATDPTKTTTVYITPSVPTSQKSAANKEIKVSLRYGQVYFVRSSETTGDLSGTKIWADAPVAVFSGNQATSVPYDDGLTDDHIFEQVIPLRYWGQKFAVTTAEYNTTYNLARVTAIYDDTEVKVNGAVKKTLKAYETYEHRVTGGSAWVETSRPTICYQYLTSAGRNYLHIKDDGTEVTFGDPSMVYVAPIEQGLDKILISAFTIEDPDPKAQADRLAIAEMEHYVNVVTKTSAVGAMRINGEPVPAGVTFSPLAGNAEYSYAKIPIADTISYLLQNEEAQFTAIVYGLAHAESYAYNAGFNNRYNDFYMYAGGGGYGGSWGGSGGSGGGYVGGYGGGIGGTGGYGSSGWRNPDQNRIDYMQVCLNEDPIEFRAIMIADGTPIKWNFGDGTAVLTNANGENLSVVNHKYDAVGRYTVTVTVEYESVARPGKTMTQDVSMIVDVVETVRDVIETGICKGGKYDFKGRTIDSDTLEVGWHTYVHNGKTAAGCDHITTLRLYVGVPTTETIDTLLCPFEIPYADERFKLFDPASWYKYDEANSSWTKATDMTDDGKFTQAGSYRYITECDRSNCDSTIIFNLTVMPAVEIKVPELSICKDTALSKLFIDPTYKLNPFDRKYPKYLYLYDAAKAEYVATKTIRTDTVGSFDYKLSNHCDTTWYCTLKVTPTHRIYDTIRICDIDTISWQNILYVGPKFEFEGDALAAAQAKYSKLIRTTEDQKEYENIFETKTVCCSECDSIRHLRLFLQSTDTVFKTPVTICSSETYTFEGVEYTYADVKKVETRTYSVVRQTATGCEYIEAVRVTINPAYTFEKDTVVFQDSVFTWGKHEESTTLYFNSSKKSYSYIASTIKAAAGNKTFTVEDRLQTKAGCDSTYILNVTVAPTFRKDTTATICDNAMLMWRGNVYAGDKFPSVDYLRGAAILSAGSYKDTVRYGTKKYNADSIVVLSLKVNKTGYELRKESLCNDETAFEFGGKTYDLSQYAKRTTIRLSDTMLTTDGCESIVDLDLTINPTYSFDDYANVFQYSPYTWVNHEHVEVPTNVAGDIVVEDRQVSQYGCDSVHYLHLHIDPTYMYWSDINLCDVDTVSWQNRLYVGYKDTLGSENLDALKVSGKYDEIIYLDVDGLKNNVYYDTVYLKTKHGADSTFYLALKLQDTYTRIKDERTICSFDEFEFAGKTYDFSAWPKRDTTIFITDTFATEACGCDSVVDLTLHIHPNYLFVTDTTICQNEITKWREHYNINEWATGTYYDSLKTVAYGCDSVYQLNLKINPGYIEWVEQELCTGDTIDFHGVTIAFDPSKDILNQKHYYEARFPRKDGDPSCDCDSIFRFVPIWKQGYHFLQIDTICQLDTVEWRGNKYTEPGHYYEEYTSVAGCDSIYELLVVMDSTYLFIDSAVICVGESYTWEDSTYVFPDSVTGWFYDYRRMQTASHLCDSVRQLSLYIAPKYRFEEFDTICQNDLPYIWHKNGKERELTESGRFFDINKTTFGCDSNYILHLHVLPSYFMEETKHICEGDTFMLSDSTVITEAGVYVDSLYSESGCDSVVEYTVVKHPTYEVYEKEAICLGSDWTWHNHSFHLWPVGKYLVRDTLQSEWGCDSIVALQLMIVPSHHIADTVTIEPGEVYDFRGQTIDHAGVYYDSLLTTLGCDSVYSVYVSYLKESYDTICQYETFQFNDTVLTTTGVYYDSLKTVNGFDSIYIQHLEVNQYYRFITEDTICRGEEYDFRGQLLTEAGVYHDSLITSGGCDSIYQLRLVVLPSGTREFYDEYCNSEVYVFMGDTIELSQFTTDTVLTFYDTIYNTTKCDSIDIYHVKVNPTYHFSYSDTVGLNQAYVWFGHEGNRLYAGAQQYLSAPTNQVGWISLNDSLHSVNGCDSVWTLNLFVAPTYFVEETDTICYEDAPYNWHGMELSASGVYTDTLLSQYGTDSVYQLSLYVRPQDYTKVRVDVCEGDTFRMSNGVAVEPGIYMDTLMNDYGCDSIVEYSVIFHPKYNIVEKEMICAGDAFTWHGISFADYPSGVYEVTDNTPSIFGCDSAMTLQLTIAPHYYFADTVTIEPGEVYDFRGVLAIDKAGVYYDSLQTTLGCDSVFSLHVSYLVERYDTICENETFEFQGELLWESGVYYDSLVSRNGFDSVYIQHLQINPNYRFVTEDTICRGDVYEYRGQYFTEAGVYNDSLISAGGCDSIYQLRLVVQPSGTREFYDAYCNTEVYVFDGDTIDLSQFTSDTTLIFEETIYSSAKCDSTIIHHVTVHPSYYFSYSDTVGLNQAYIWLGHEGHRLYEGAQQYLSVPTNQVGWISLNDSLHSVYGCDSVWTLNLYVAPTYLMTTTDTICHEDVPYVWRGQKLYETGVYTDSLYSSQYGTDSICQISLYVRPLDYTKVRVDICEGDTFRLSNGIAVETGVYMDTLQSGCGCDSIVEYLVVANPKYSVTEHAVICVGDDYTWHGQSFAGFASGQYEIVDSSSSVMGCDSVVTLHLTIAPKYYFADTVTIEPGEVYNFHGRDISRAGVYYDTLQTTLGCDSVFSLRVSYLVERYDTICENETFEFQGMNLFESGVYYDSLMTKNGFDSVYIQHLEVAPKYRFVINDTICRGEEYDFRGQLLSQPGIYYDSLVSVSGCDSIYQLHLVVQPSGTRDVYAEYCNSETYVFGTDTIALSQYTSDTTLIFHETIYNSAKCDSTVIYYVTVHPTYSFTYSDTVGLNETYEWVGHEGHTLYKDGAAMTTIPTSQLGWISLTDSLRSVYGCDSVWTLNLYVAPTYLDVATDTICYEDVPYVWRGRELTASGVYNDTLLSQYGTDSVFQMQLYVRALDYTVEQVDICAGDTFYYANNAATVTGIYMDTLKNGNGCDSIVEYRLTVHNHYHFVDREIICEGDAFVWRNHTFSGYASGKYEVTDSLVSSWGCDSVYTLQLIVATKHHVLDSATICPGEEYNFRGQLLTEAGLYHDTLQTTLGCDSIFSLHLSYLCASYDTICQSELFEFRGEWYHSTGVYYDSLKTVNGYDSVFVEYLQVNPKYRFVTEDTICRGEVYEFRGQYYTEPGIYNDSLISSGGCDSIYQLRLVVHPSGTREVYDSYCNNEVYVFLGETIDLSQFTTDTTLIFHETIHNSVKCDSTVIHYVSVHPTYNFTYSDTVGLNQVYNWVGHEGHTLYQDGATLITIPTGELGWISLTDSLRTAYGCDSIWTLNLYVAPTYLDVATDTICYEEMPYVWRGRELTASGVYNDTLYSQYGTDSVFQMQLYVRPLDYTALDVHICAGDTFFYANNAVTSSGIYMDTLKNGNGCDSIVAYNLTVHKHYLFEEREIICEGDNYVWRGHTFSDYTSGVYTITDALVSSWGCDSVYSLQLFVAKSYHFVDSATICPGDVYDFRGKALTKAGWYHDNMHTTLGCDSTYSIYLSYECVSYDTICFGDYYDFHGTLLSESGVYYDSLKTTTGIDSVFVEYLYVEAPYAIMRYDTICDNEWYDFNGMLLNETGTYFDTLVTAHGCDSVEVLNLYVTSTTLTVLYDTLCVGDSYVFFDQVLTEPGMYANISVNDYGCEHVDSLYLAQIEPTQVYVASTEFCADDRYLNFEFRYAGKEPVGYSIHFSEEAKEQGFVDLLDQVIEADNVVSIPFLGDNSGNAYPRPGNYTATVFLQNGICSDSLVMQEVAFRVKYPSWIMEQNWNDVIAILVDSLNGGYEFSEYQWYHNGRPIYGETKPYLYAYPALDMQGEYTVELTRVGDGEKIMSCPIYPRFVEDHTVSYNATIVVTPTIMQKVNPVCTLYSDANAEWYVYSTDGLSLTQGTIAKDIPVQITLPEVSTTYFMVVRTENDYVKFIKLIVQ